MKYLDFIEARQKAKPVTIDGELFNAVTVDVTGDMAKRVYKITHIKGNKISKATRVKVGFPDKWESKFLDKYSPKEI